MAIVILIFTIQASFALEEDNDFNLTKTNDVNTVNVQIDKNRSDNIIVNDSKVAVNSTNNVLGATNQDVLGTDRHASQEGIYTYAQLNTFLRNARNGDNVFLDGITFSGTGSSIINIQRSINIYGGSTIDDPTPAILDLSQFTGNILIQAQGSAIDVSMNNIVFKNFNRPESNYLIACGMWSSYMGAIVINNCTFINNTVAPGGVIVRYVLYDKGSVLSNCNFYNNTASNIVYIGTRNENSPAWGADSFEAYNNTFINNVGTYDGGKNSTNSLGLCFKVMDYVRSARFDHNTFINNTNAVHGTAYCLMAKNVTISNDYIEGNQAVYGSGIEAHNGNIQVYNTTFISNLASGYYSSDKVNENRSGSGAAISFAAFGAASGNNIVQNCTFISNTAGNYSGAIDIVGDNTKILDCTFYDNTAINKFGGAMSISGKDTYILFTIVPLI